MSNRKTGTHIFTEVAVLNAVVVIVDISDQGHNLEKKIINVGPKSKVRSWLVNYSYIMPC